jgi:hypothetical protein
LLERKITKALGVSLNDLFLALNYRILTIMVYTKIKNRILDKILTSNFTKRQLKILLFIIRFSYELGRKYAVLKKKDFYFAGILPYHVEEELKKLILRGVVKWNPKLGIFWINRNLKEWVDKKQKVDLFKG